MTDARSFPPFDRDELADVRARSDRRMAGPSWTEPDVDRARLLATLDAERERHVTVLRDMRERGVISVDRAKWARYVPDDDVGLFIAYVPFAALTAAETEAYFEEYPEKLDEVNEMARALAERYGIGKAAGGDG